MGIKEQGTHRKLCLKGAFRNSLSRWIATETAAGVGFLITYIRSGDTNDDQPDLQLIQGRPKNKYLFIFVIAM